jgi:redox-sensitive bicupin YhaK (pirin superfamily)
MLAVRKGNERGHADFGWLDSRHSFSFGQYHDPRHMGFGPLRVINDDIVAGGGGFPPHPHADMEIISYVLEGGLAHRDSLGNSSVIRPGDIQMMTAGTGVRHSEFNASKTDPVRFLQIWIMPQMKGVAPGYSERNFPAEEKRGRLRLIVSRDGRDGSATVNQDVDIHAAILSPGETVSHAFAPGRLGWLQIARGAVTANGVALREGDGLAIEAEAALTIASDGGAETELLLFDMIP